MRIVDRGEGWVVVAPWYGAERVVYSGSLWECIAWEAAHGGCP